VPRRRKSEGRRRMVAIGVDSPSWANNAKAAGTKSQKPIYFPQRDTILSHELDFPFFFDVSGSPRPCMGPLLTEVTSCPRYTRAAAVRTPGAHPGRLQVRPTPASPRPFLRVLGSCGSHEGRF